MTIDAVRVEFPSHPVVSARGQILSRSLYSQMGRIHAAAVEAVITTLALTKCCGSIVAKMTHLAIRLAHDPAVRVVQLSIHREPPVPIRLDVVGRPVDAFITHAPKITLWGRR